MNDGREGVARGRPRRISNPPNPYTTEHVEWLGAPGPIELQVFEERAHSLLSKNESPDVPFRFSANAYRGCQHGCAYCYARTSHEFLGFGSGTDFDSKLVVKRNAPEVLSLELGRSSWKRETVCISGNTDPYQPLEASFGLTRRLLEVCLARHTPVAVITKGALVERDIDVLARLAKGPGAIVHVSIPFLDAAVARAMEPGAPTPERRLKTLGALAQAGVEVGISLAPMIPGLNDPDVPTLVERAAAAGASRAFASLLRLPGSVRDVFFERLERALPERAQRVQSALLELRGGALGDSRFGHRMRGRGPRWDAMADLLSLSCRRFGLELGETHRPAMPNAAGVECQGDLFGE